MAPTIVGRDQPRSPQRPTERDRHAASPQSRRSAPLPKLAKCPTGIHGLDTITGGGLPRGRPTLVCGGSGSGKTLFGMEFLVRGIQEHNEPGVFMCFEERAKDLAQNVASLGFDLPDLIADKKLVVDAVTIDRDEIMETGEYNLDGLFIRLDAAIDAVGAKRVVLDTIETLFAALSNANILRLELRRLFALAQGEGRHRHHHRRAGRGTRSPATASKNTSPTA